MNGKSEGQKVFTSLTLCKLINEKVLKNDKTVQQGDPRIRGLADQLNLFRMLATQSNTVWREEKGQVELIKAATKTLVDTLPYVVHHHTAFSLSLLTNAPPFVTGTDNLAQQIKESRIALQSLLDAAILVTRLGLPRPFSPPNPPGDTWQEWAVHLEGAFHASLPGHKKAAAYRFIVEVAPKITGDNPSFQAVESQLKKKRPVNRGKNKR